MKPEEVLREAQINIDINQYDGAYGFTAESDIFHIILNLEVDKKDPEPRAAKMVGHLYYGDALCGLFLGLPERGDEVYPVESIDEFVFHDWQEICPSLRICKKCQKIFNIQRETGDK